MRQEDHLPPATPRFTTFLLTLLRPGSLKNDKEYFEIDEARVEEKWDEGYIIPKDSKSGLKGLENFTGDDPLYIAIGVAGAFAAWASTGGLTLH